MAIVAKLPQISLMALLVLAAPPVLAQRIQFPSAIQTDTTSPAAPLGSSTTAAPNSGWQPYSYGATTAPAYPAPAYPNSAVPGQLTPTPASPAYPGPPAYGQAPVYGQGPVYGTAPSYTPAPAPGYAPAPNYGATPMYGAQPTAGAPPVYAPSPVVVPPPTGLPNSAVLPPPSWDPYGSPAVQPAPLLSQDPYLQGAPAAVPITFSNVFKFRQDIHLEYLWMTGNAYEEFGFNQFDINGTFAFPFFSTQQSPILVTPGLTVYFMSNPSLDGPHQLYDSYLDTAWNPRVNDWFSGELGFRIGVYSDFNRVIAQSIRYTGHGLAVLAFSPSIQIKAGVVYLDRVYVKMLPAGGIVWTPNADARCDFLFPNPKISRRIITYGTADWWLYLRGEYGGDSWTMPGFWTPAGFQPNPDQRFQQVDYNDIRVALGVECIRRGGLSGSLEIGGAFDREIRPFPTGAATFEPNPTVFLHASLTY